MSEPHRAPPIENPQVAVVIFGLIAFMLVQCIYAVYGPGAQTVAIYLFPLNFALLLATVIYLRAITRLSMLVLVDEQLYKKGWNTSELIPHERISMVVLDRRFSGRRNRVSHYQVVVLLEDGERLIVSESRNYFSSRKKAEQFSRWLQRPQHDETLDLTRDWEDLDEPFHRMLLKEGRTPSLPSPPGDEKVELELTPDQGAVRLKLPSESTRGQIGSVFVVVILVGAGVGYSFYQGPGALVGSGFFISLCAAALPDARVLTSTRLLEVNGDGLRISWMESNETLRQTLHFPKGEIEGLWPEDDCLHLLTDHAHEEVLFPNPRWASYARDCAFFVFSKTDETTANAVGDGKPLPTVGKE